MGDNLIRWQLTLSESETFSCRCWKLWVQVQSRVTVTMKLRYDDVLTRLDSVGMHELEGQPFSVNSMINALSFAFSLICFFTHLSNSSTDPIAPSFQHKVAG